MRVGIAETESLPKVAIVGGGFGGLIAAIKLAEKRLRLT
jgi:cation diffusion facilitator CzcD-associated flavoprotein CzcO